MAWGGAGGALGGRRVHGGGQAQGDPDPQAYAHPNSNLSE